MSKEKAKPESESDAAVESDAPKASKPRVLSQAKRDGKTVRVMTDDVRVWKETEE